MLNLYSIFHLNLSYSSIEEEQRAEVIEKCYWPLLKLVDELDLQFGIEVSGYTLETIQKIDSSWIAKLKTLLQNNKCEFIGSGYAQIIGPLVPAEVNDWNQKIGKDIYQKILGVTPNLALVNEMAYSSGIMEHYISNGYKAIIMEWNNPRKYHPEWENEWRYFPQRVVGSEKRTIPLVWTDSIAFQKFQRYVHREYELDEYINYLEGHLSSNSIRYFPLYANDVEIFNFRPGRYETELDLSDIDEWQRIRDLFTYLKINDSFDIVFPSEVLKGINTENGGKYIFLESPEQPIPVKKQEKYNINRWALTGRDDLKINTKCYQIYYAIRGKVDATDEDWRELCYFWSSDFRTHITEKRWNTFERQLDDFCRKWGEQVQSQDEQERARFCKDTPISVYETDKFITITTETIECTLYKQRGLSIDKCFFKNLSNKFLLGTLPHGYYDDISLGADFYSGHTIIEKPGEHKITDLQPCVPSIERFADSSLTVEMTVKNKGVVFKKRYRFFPETSYFEISMNIELPSRFLSMIHPLHFTFIPSSFDRDSIFYATHNGGWKMEKFKIGNNVIHHAQSLSFLISAKYGLGATEGMVIIGDREKQISIQYDQAMAALIPSVHFSSMNNDNYFLRLSYSAQEVDETFKENYQVQKVEFHWKISSCQGI